jgi:predicted ester cyclase
VKLTVNDVIAEKDRVALNLSANGTHQSRFLGFAATGNKINFKEMFFFRIKNRKIVDGWDIVNVENVKEQLKKK